MRNLLLVLLISFATSLPAEAQLADLNTKTPYHPQQRRHTPAPKGFKAVFINYTGRHGARFQTSVQKDALIEDILQQARQQDALTSTGSLVYEDIKRLEGIEKDRYGNITKLGEEEQYGIAERMRTEYPGVFTNGKLLVEMTDKVRTQQSAASFLPGLGSYDSSMVQKVIIPAEADSLLRFYDLSEAYKNYLSGTKIKQHTDSLIEDRRMADATQEVCSRLFTKSFIAKLNKGEVASEVKDKKQTVTTAMFSLALYDVYASLFSASEEVNKDIRTGIGSVFSDRSLHWFNEVTSASDFYEKGPADDVSGIQVAIAAPLLRDLLNTADSAIRFHTYDAVLRFTHAEAVSPLAALLGIPAASKESRSVFAFSKTWKASEIIPMSANVQWILYRNGARFLLKVLLNEKEVALPVATQSFPYYDWNDVQTYYQNKLSLLNKN